MMSGNGESSKKFPMRKVCWVAGLMFSWILSLRMSMSMTTREYLKERKQSVDFPVHNDTSSSADNLSSKSVVKSTTERRPGNETDNGMSKVFPRICRGTNISTPIWEWHHYSNGTKRGQARLLVATYSAFGRYARLLELTAPINKAYAQHWNHDMVVVQGTTMILPWDFDCAPPEERSRFNKIDILMEAIKQKDQYDQLLLLDADTLVYDFAFDITSLASSNDTMLVAQRTHLDDFPATSKINNGITLWNLHHPLTREVAEDWSSACRYGIPDNRPFRGDQYYLHEILSSSPERIASIYGVWDEFYYRDGTVVKHFQRSNDRSWDETGLDVREKRILNATQQICERYGIGQKDLDQKNYTAVSGSNSTVVIEPECHPRRKSKWDLIPYSTNATSTKMKDSSNRLLIAQYSSFGSYASLLDKTSPYNKAYARRWGHDFLVVQGIAIGVNDDELECEPPQHHSMYNKIPILVYAISKAESYDQLLLLDADTIIVDFDYDVTTLLDNETVVAAHRVNQSDSMRTWNINNGITLWNLHHDCTPLLARRWLQRTIKGMNVSRKNGSKDHSDQHYLHQALRMNNEALLNHTKALKDEFRYEKATVIKHFVRPKHEWTGYAKDRRESKIELTASTICSNFSADCANLERVEYSKK